MLHVAVCSRCGDLFEAGSEECANAPVRECVRCWLDRVHADTVPVDVFRRGDRVQIYNLGLREHGVLGVVRSYDSDSQFYSVVLDSAPTLRGLYARSELVLVARSA